MKNFWTKSRKNLILIFIAAFIYVINGYWLGGHLLTGHLSKKLSWKERFFYPSWLISNYLGFGGSRWTVFSPDTIHLSHYIYVVVESDNATPQIWTYPNQGRYLKYGESFRRYLPRSRYSKVDRLLMADLAGYVARMYESTKCHPTKEYIVRRIESIPPPGRSFCNIYQQPHDKILFTYNVESSDLLAK